MIRKEPLWKNDLKFVKDGSVICVNFIIIIYLHKKLIFIPPFVFVLKPMPVPQKKTAASDTEPLRFVLSIAIKNCVQNASFNTKKERKKERRKERCK